VGLGLLALAFNNIDLDEVWEEMKNADYSWILASMVVALGSHWFRALRWNQLINQLNYKTKTSSTFYAVMTGYMANLALPRLGEVSRCAVLSKKDNIPFNALFGTVIAERVFDLIVLIIILLAVVLYQIKLIGGFINDVILKPLLGTYAGNFTAILIIATSSIILIIIGIFVFRRLRPWLKSSPLYSKIEVFLDGLWDGIKSIGQLENKWKFFFNTFMIWFLYLIMLMLPFYSFEETSILGIIDGMTVLTIGSLGIVAPVPGGIGSYHFIITELFTQLFDIPASAAIAYATTNHAAQTVLNLVAGGIGYILLILSKSKPLNEKPQEDQE